MNWLDIVILVVLVISVFSGMRAGIIKVAFTLAGGIIGVVLAGRYSEGLADKLTFISDSGIAGIVAFAIILIVVMVVATVIAFIIKKIASAVLLGWVDKIGGAVVGLFVGAIFVGAVLAMWLKFQGGNDFITDSALANFLVDKFGIVLGLLPSEFQSVQDFFN